MFSNQKLQNALMEIKEITAFDTALFTAKGKRLAYTGEQDAKMEQMVFMFVDSKEDEQMIGNYQFYKVYVEEDMEYILVFHTEGKDISVIGPMAVCQIRNLAMSFLEKFDRNNFMQNILSGNMLVTDIYSKAKKLHIEPKKRVVYVVDTAEKNNDIVSELVKNLSDIKAGDFILDIDEHSVVLIKDVSFFTEENMEAKLQEVAVSLVDTLHMEAMVKVRVGYGNIVEQISQIAESYQEARIALEVGKIFYAQLDTISYGKLGIGRLIYQLPMDLCGMFIKEVFGETIPEIFSDEETMSLIQKFLDNNLNISETARQLYVHRNTLVYRLERIEKSIGLDIRKFDEAMIFRIAAMVLAHMKRQGI